jgi:hypothetical protein
MSLREQAIRELSYRLWPNCKDMNPTTLRGGDHLGEDHLGGDHLGGDHLVGDHAGYPY